MKSTYADIGTMNVNSANFVNAPAEYSDRARDTIKKKLLLSGEKNRGLRIRNNDVASVYSDNSNQSSIFSNPLTVTTTASNFSVFSGDDSHTKVVTEVTLEDALPKTFYDMYTPEILMSNPLDLFHNGRPKFTKRELMNWDLNDIRSLLIIETMRPEWGNHLPRITLPNNPNVMHNSEFRFQLLPLNSSDEFIIETLVHSDLYKEANLDFEFRLTSARYTVALARKRHEQMLRQQGVPQNQINRTEMNLTKPEWRNIIENYLLNIAVETQCRTDFKQKCSEFKKWRQEQILLQQQQQNLRNSNLRKPHMPPPSGLPLYTIAEEGSVVTNQSTLISNQSNSCNPSSSLLKKTLMKNLISKKKSSDSDSTDMFSNNSQLAYTNNANSNDINNNNNHTHNNIPNNQSPNNSIPHQKFGKVSLTKGEKADIWLHCQSEVYQRLGLDWKPDRMSSF